MPALHVVIATHTPLHLRRTLLGVACSSRRPDSVTVSTDNDRADIADVVADAVREFGDGLRDGDGRGVTLVQRPHQGACRLTQVNNNAVRSLLRRGASDADRVVFLQGDCVPARQTLAGHERLGAAESTAAHGAERGARALVVAYRVDCTPAQTESFDESALAAGHEPVDITAHQRDLLARRDARYRRALALKRVAGAMERRLGLGGLGALGLVKPHKPKALGAHLSLDLGTLRAINGFDEEFQFYGSEDDDLSRRAYAAGARGVVGVRELVVYHLFHPTRRPASWIDDGGAKLFSTARPVRCVRGLDNPVTPNDTTERVFGERATAPARVHLAPTSPSRDHALEHASP